MSIIINADPRVKIMRNLTIKEVFDSQTKSRNETHQEIVKKSGGKVQRKIYLKKW